VDALRGWKHARALQPENEVPPAEILGRAFKLSKFYSIEQPAGLLPPYVDLNSIRAAIAETPEDQRLHRGEGIASDDLGEAERIERGRPARTGLGAESPLRRKRRLD